MKGTTMTHAGEAGDDDDLATLLQRREHARPTRVTWALLGLLLVAAGFLGGAYANGRWGSTSASTALPAGFPTDLPAGFPTDLPAAMAGGFPGTGSGAGSGASSAATTGTVTLVDKGRLYLTTASGETVIVTVPASADVTTQREVALSDLAVGATVTVQGATGDDGTVTATSVSTTHQEGN